MSDDIVGRVISVIAQTQSIPVESITWKSTFEELGIDSLTGLSLVHELENEFGVEVPNEQVLAIRSVKEIVACLEPLVLPNGVNTGEPARSPR
jgi:acyl carrier protein